VLYAGILALLKHRGFWNADIALLVLTGAYVILVSSGPEAYSRFRMPVMPIFCILAAGGYLYRVESRFGAKPSAMPANVAGALPRMSTRNG